MKKPQHYSRHTNKTLAREMCESNAITIKKANLLDLLKFMYFWAGKLNKIKIN